MGKEGYRVLKKSYISGYIYIFLFYFYGKELVLYILGPLNNPYPSSF